jgi:general secretion pathway protein J
MALINYNSQCRQEGMTLLEVLVAMTLMVVISAIAFASLNGLIDAKNQTDTVAKQVRQEMLTSVQLNKDFDAMILRSVKNTFGGRKAAVIGRYSSIEFSRNGHNNPLQQTRSELQRVQWFIRDKQLIRGELNLLDTGSNVKWHMHPYLDQVKEFNISYVNRLGQLSRIWPIQNNNNPLHHIQLEITLEDGSRLKYFMRPLL